ncbi:hypothetical protein ABZ468_39405 [Streptomyces sp. NPDC005708]|uniref:hypothetical protein n=1 Tax=Streptomyces sp. NPDC005708 TaxID=3154564 RepID=UPI0033FB100B
MDLRTDILGLAQGETGWAIATGFTSAEAVLDLDGLDAGVLTQRLPQTRWAVAACARDPEDGLLEVAGRCEEQDVPLIVVVLGPYDLRIGPAYGRPPLACYPCRVERRLGARDRVAQQLATHYGQHPERAPIGGLGHHVEFAVCAVTAELESLSDAAGSPAAERVLDLSRNTLSTLPADPAACRRHRSSLH